METVVGTIDLTPTRQETERIRAALLEGLRNRRAMIESIDNGEFNLGMEEAFINPDLIERVFEGWRASERRAEQALLDGVNECNRALGLEPL